MNNLIYTNVLDDFRPNLCDPMVDGPFLEPRVDTINTPNIGPIDEGLIWISPIQYQIYGPVKRIKWHGISYDGTTTK